MKICNFEPVSQRRRDFKPDGIDTKALLDATRWRKAMFTSAGSKFFENDNSKTQTESKIRVIDPDLQRLSQKVMGRVWDNKEDEFWTDYYSDAQKF